MKQSIKIKKINQVIKDIECKIHKRGATNEEIAIIVDIKNELGLMD